MVSTTQSKWAVRGASLVLWGLVAASVTYWGLKLASRPAGAAVPRPASGTLPADPAAVARLLGAVPAAAMAAPIINLYSRFALLGVVATRGRAGAALIAVDGKAARPFRVGSAVDEGLILQSVQGRRAVLATSAGGQAVVTLELPPIKR